MGILILDDSSTVELWIAETFEYLCYSNGLLFRYAVPWYWTSEYLKPDHLKSDLQKVRISNVSGFQMVGFQIPTVLNQTPLAYFNFTWNCKLNFTNLYFRPQETTASWYTFKLKFYYLPFRPQETTASWYTFGRSAQTRSRSNEFTLSGDTEMQFRAWSSEEKRIRSTAVPTTDLSKFGI